MRVGTIFGVTVYKTGFVIIILAETLLISSVIMKKSWSMKTNIIIRMFLQDSDENGDQIGEF